MHPYRPKKADLDDLLRFESQLGISHVCLIAFSVYHTDNSSIVDALTKLGGKGRAVVCIDPEAVTDGELRKLHGLGARGVRLNLKTRDQRLGKIEFEGLLKSYADKIRCLGWALQLFVAMEQIDLIADVLPTLGIPVVIDHLGAPHPSKGAPKTQPGYEAFMKLLRSGQVWTKLSGTYRFDKVPGLEEYIMDVLRIAPNRVVWASDWPHSGGAQANPGGDCNAIQEYRKIDDRAWVDRCKSWCRAVSGENLIRKIWRDNPRALWQYDDK